MGDSLAAAGRASEARIERKGCALACCYCCLLCYAWNTLEVDAGWNERCRNRYRYRNREREREEERVVFLYTYGGSDRCGGFPVISPTENIARGFLFTLEHAEAGV